MDPFDSAWLKWARAVVHAQALEASIASVDADPEAKPFGRIREEYQPKRHGFAVIVDHIEPMPVHWNMLLGDVASNLRASLDHIAWAIYKRGRTPNLTDAQEGRIYFPITKSASHYRNVIAGKLPGALRTDLAVVRRHQPWKRGKTAVPWHCLTVLDSVVQSDKHREIQGLWMLPKVSGVYIVSAQDCAPGRVRGKNLPMEIDTELGFIHARKTGPHPKIQVQYEITAYPAFHPQLRLQDWMDIATITVMNLLGNFAEMPNSAEFLGIEPEPLEAAVATWNRTAAAWAGAKGRQVPILKL